MKQRHSRHKHSTWRAYRRKVAWERLSEAITDCVVPSGNRMGFVRSLAMSDTERAAARARQEREHQEFVRKRAERRALQPRLTRFK